jgi:hypothetical protein
LGTTTANDSTRSFSSGGPTGLRGPTDPTGQFAGHTSANSYAGNPTGVDPTKSQQYSSGQHSGGVGSNYQGAVSDYANLDGLSKLFESPPNINQAATYKNGLAHTGTNPLGALTALASGFFAPGSGLLVGPAMSWVGRKIGVPDVVFGDASPGAPRSEIHDFSSQTSKPSANGKPNGNGTDSNTIRNWFSPAKLPAVDPTLAGLVNPKVYTSPPVTVVP